MIVKPTPRKIALWGYAQRGRELFEELRSHGTHLFNITMVFDKAVRDDANSLLDGAIPLLNSSQMAKEYARGSFEAVLPAVGVTSVKEEMCRHLEDLGIPVATNLERGDFLGFGEFENTSETVLPNGSVLHEYRGIFGTFSPVYPEQVALFLFDAKGRLAAENWFSDAFDWDPLIEQCIPPLEKDERPIRRLSGSCCILARAFGMNYWHFIYQHLDQMLLMEQAGYGGRYLLPRSNAAEELVELFGVGRERILWLDELERGFIYQFEKACIISQRLYDPTRSAPLVVGAANRIASALMEKDDEQKEYPSRIFVKRIGSRRLLGADELIKSHGFVTIVPEELSIAEQIRHFRHADIVLTPHGANSANSVFMRPKSVFIETFGKRYALPLCTQTLALQEVFYLPVVETPIVEDIKASGVADYSIPPDILESAIKAGVALVQSPAEKPKSR